MDIINSFVEYLNKFHIDLTKKQIDQFVLYYEILIKKNKVMNLTSITDFNDVFVKHFMDSLSILEGIDIVDYMYILDMGTGAGFPGIPIKIIFPKCKVVLMDSLNKRVKFLDEVIEKLNLENIVAIHGRAEDFGKDTSYREKFDLCVSRAVANLTTLSEYCLPYVRVNGYFIPYKSGHIDLELKDSLNAIQILGGTLEDQIVFNLPNTNIERTLLKIKKIRQTSGKYPRTSGKPSKEPIL